MDRLRRVLVLNCGSSTLKWTVFDAADESTAADGCEPLLEAAAEPVRAILDRVGDLDAVGHRIVHGGALFRETVLVDARSARASSRLWNSIPFTCGAPWTPSMQFARGFRRCRSSPRSTRRFTRRLPESAAGYGLPFEWTERWRLRRFGFHGLSVAHAVERAREMTGRTPPRLVVCHLGSGCSVTAVKEGRSFDTTMGFTPLEGLMMATRSGSVDPGLILHLQSRRGLSAAELWEALTEKSGLLGVSGVSGDLREVLAAAGAGSARATLAYERFILSAKRAIGSMTAVLGGLDALVFTGGIGENSPRVRRDLVSCLAFAGAVLDEEANEAATTDM